MNEHDLIGVALKFVGALLSIIGFLALGIFKWVRSKIEKAATKAELRSLDRDLRLALAAHKEAREARDKSVDTMLGQINVSLVQIHTGINRTHERIDELFARGADR